MLTRDYVFTHPLTEFCTKFFLSIFTSCKRDLIIRSAVRARFSNCWTTLDEAEAILKILSVDSKILSRFEAEINQVLKKVDEKQNKERIPSHVIVSGEIIVGVL